MGYSSMNSWSREVFIMLEVFKIFNPKIAHLWVIIHLQQKPSQGRTLARTVIEQSYCTPFGHHDQTPIIGLVAQVINKLRVCGGPEIIGAFPYWFFMPATRV